MTARRTIPELGATVLTLSNGVEVWLKPTDFKNDQVSVQRLRAGGTSLASEAGLPSASSPPRWSASAASAGSTRST